VLEKEKKREEYRFRSRARGEETPRRSRNLGKEKKRGFEPSKATNVARRGMSKGRERKGSSGTKETVQGKKKDLRWEGEEGRTFFLVVGGNL